MENLTKAFPQVYLLGASCWATWVLLMFSGKLFYSVEGNLQIYLTYSYVISTAVLAIVTLILSIFNEKAVKLFASLRFMMACGILASCGTLLILLAISEVLPIGLLHVGNAFTGAGTACIALRCGCQFSKIEPRNSIVLLCLMMAVSLLVAAFVFALPQEVAWVIFVLLPSMAALLSYLDLFLEKREHPEENRSNNRKFLIACLLIVVALFFVCGYFPQMLNGGRFASAHAYDLTIAFMGLAIIVVIAVVLPEKVQLSVFYYWVLVAFALILVGISLGGNSAYLSSSFSVIDILLNVVAWGLLSCLCYRVDEAGALRIFGLGRTGIAFGATVGWWMGSFPLQSASPSFLIICAFLLVIFIMTISIFGYQSLSSDAAPRGIFDSQGVGTLPEHTAEATDQEARGSLDQRASDYSRQEQDGVSASDEEAAAAQRLQKGDSDKKQQWIAYMEEIAVSKGFSERETEVFLQLARGRDLQSIGSDLFISYNTVRTHVRNIYAKVGVHSRFELEEYVKEKWAAAKQKANAQNSDE